MPNQSTRMVQPSMSRSAVADGGGTNTSCHGSTAGVQPNGKHVVDSPQIVLVLWDNQFVTNAAAVTSAEQLVTDLVTGAFMNGLAQYGVERGSVINTVTIDTKLFPAPSTWDIG